MLQQQPSLWLAMYPIDLDTDLHLQMSFCGFYLGPTSSQWTYLTIYTLGRLKLLSPALPYSPHCCTVGVHTLLVKSLFLACLLMTFRFCIVVPCLPLLQLNCICHHVWHLSSLSKTKKRKSLPKSREEMKQNSTRMKYLTEYTSSPEERLRKLMSLLLIMFPNILYTIPVQKH